MSKKKIVALACVLVLAVAAVILGLGVPTNFAVDTAKSRIEAQTGYRLHVGSVRFGLWPLPTIVARDIGLSDPKGRNTPPLFTAESIQAGIALTSLLSLKPRIAEIVVSNPVVRAPQGGGQPIPSGAPAAGGVGSGGAMDPAAFSIDRVTIENGTLVLPDDRGEKRIAGINLDVFLPSDDGRLDVMASGTWDGEPVRLSVEASVPNRRIAGETLPIKLNLEAPGLLQGALSATGDVKLMDRSVAIDNMRGTVGRNRFSARASADLAGKRPLVKVALDFGRLDFAGATQDPPIIDRSAAAGAPQPSWLEQPWNERPIRLDALSVVDAELRVSAGELNTPSARFAPFYVEAKLINGALSATVSRTGLAGGQVEGTIAVDASAAVPRYAVQLGLTGADAASVLAGALDFHAIEGRMQARFDLRATGASERAIISTLSGTTDVQFEDGAIRGVNIAKMIRALTAKTLDGWQRDSAEKTDLTQLAATFRLENGQAKTDNLRLTGPLVRVTGAGSSDLIAKTMTFKVEPRLVLSLEGQGGAVNPVGLGVPVIVQGPWSGPRIYPDVAGILDNPGAAYEQLRALGQGLFGSGGGQSAAPVETIIQGIGPLINPAGRDAAAKEGDARRQPTADDVVRALNELVGGNRAPAAPGAGEPQPPQGKQPPVQDILRQLLGR